MVENFFQTYSKDLPSLLNSNLYDNVNILSKLIGVFTHPLFKTTPKYNLFDESQPLISNTIENTQNIVASTTNIQASQTNLVVENNNKVVEPNFILITNTKIDYVTAKILNVVWALSKFNVLKFYIKLIISFSYHTNFKAE